MHARIVKAKDWYKERDRAPSEERSESLGVREALPARTNEQPNISGGDTVWGNTRSHPEHDGEDHIGRRYCIGDDTGE